MIFQQRNELLVRESRQIGRPKGPAETTARPKQAKRTQTLSTATNQPCAARAAFGAETCPTLDLAWLFIILPSTHLLLDSTAFHELSEATNRLLNRLAIPDDKPNHSSS